MSVVLDELKKSHKRWLRKAELLKEKSDRCIGAPLNIIKARKSAATLLKVEYLFTREGFLKRMGELAEDERQAFRDSKQNTAKLIDDQIDAELNVSKIESEINRLEFRKNRIWSQSC